MASTSHNPAPLESPLVRVDKGPLRPKVLDLYEALFFVGGRIEEKTN